MFFQTCPLLQYRVDEFVRQPLRIPLVHKINIQHYHDYDVWSLSLDLSNDSITGWRGSNERRATRSSSKCATVWAPSEIFYPWMATEFDQQAQAMGQCEMWIGRERYCKTTLSLTNNSKNVLVLLSEYPSSGLWQRWMGIPGCIYGKARDESAAIEFFCGHTIRNRMPASRRIPL